MFPLWSDSIVESGLTLAWEGRGQIRIARGEGAVWLRLDALTTQTRTLKRTADRFFRKEARWLRPAYAGEFSVDVGIETTPAAPRMDVDNVAKAVLDALTGAVYRDDSQVARLLVERAQGEAPRIWVRAAPLVDGKKG